MVISRRSAWPSVEAQESEDLVDFRYQSPMDVPGGAGRDIASQRPDPPGDFGNLQQPSNPRQIDAPLVDERLDESQPIELLTGIHPHTAQGALWPDQTEPLVLSQRLRMHVQQVGRHADEVQLGSFGHGFGLPAAGQCYGSSVDIDMTRVNMEFCAERVYPAIIDCRYLGWREKETEPC